MAETTEVGGLNQVAQTQEAPPQDEEIQAQQPVDNISALFQKSRDNRKELDAQIARLSQSLEKRKNLPVNPMWLEIAQAAATPSSTGSAFQGLGRIAGALGKAQANESQRQIDIEKSQLELAQKRQALNQEDLNQQAMLNIASGRGLGGIQQPAPAPAAPAGAAPAKAPSAALASSTTPVSPPVQDLPPADRMRPVTDKDIALMSAISPSLGEHLSKLSEVQRKAQMVTAEGIYDTMSGKWVTRFEMPIERPVRVLGKVAMTKNQSQEYDKLMDEMTRQNATEEQKDQATANWAASNGIGGVTRGAVGPDGKPTFKNFLDPQSAALENKNRETALANRLEENKEVRKSVYEKQRIGQTTVQAADSMYKLATNKETQGGFGLLKNPGVLNAFAVAVTEGMNVGGSQISFPGLESALRLAKPSITNTEIRAVEMYAQSQSILQLMASQQYYKGQGQVSDNERRLVTNLVGSASDTPKSIAMKAKVVEARARYDMQIADLFYKFEKNNPTGTFQDFVQTDPEYTKLFKAYDKHMGALFDTYFPTKGESAPPKTPPSPGSRTPKVAPAPYTPGPLEQRIMNSKKKVGS
jgi:hypothetical protein